MISKGKTSWDRINQLKFKMSSFVTSSALNSCKWPCQGVNVHGVVFLLVAAIVTPNLLHAQSRAGGKFHFDKEVHWGSTVLPAGDYFITVPAAASAEGPMVVAINQKDGKFLTTITPQSATAESLSGSSRVVMAGDGGSEYVTSLYLREAGTTFTFAPPGGKSAAIDSQSASAQTSPDPAASDAALISIINPHSQAVPSVEAEAIYISACKVVEQEYGRVDPVRPHVKLVLGADKEGVYYPNREIRLTKWDKYRFAQGVVVLAADELLTRDKRISLTQLAVSAAESTVDVDQLKNERDHNSGMPQN